MRQHHDAFSSDDASQSDARGRNASVSPRIESQGLSWILVRIADFLNHSVSTGRMPNGVVRPFAQEKDTRKITRPTSRLGRNPDDGDCVVCAVDLDDELQ